jgi:phage gp16-like protein
MSFNPLIAKLHIAKKQLGLDDASYRALLVAATGKSSAKDMREGELVAAMEAFKKAGFKALPPKTAEQKAAARKPYVAKIYALWGDLEKSGDLTDPSLKALQSFVKRQTGMDRVEWLGPEDATKVTEGLKAWLARLSQNRQARLA